MKRRLFSYICFIKIGWKLKIPSWNPSIGRRRPILHGPGFIRLMTRLKIAMYHEQHLLKSVWQPFTKNDDNSGRPLNDANYYTNLVFNAGSSYAHLLVHRRRQQCRNFEQLKIKKQDMRRAAIKPAGYIHKSGIVSLATSRQTKSSVTNMWTSSRLNDNFICWY